MTLSTILGSKLVAAFVISFAICGFAQWVCNIANLIKTLKK